MSSEPLDDLDRVTQKDYGESAISLLPARLRPVVVRDMLRARLQEYSDFEERSVSLGRQIEVAIAEGRGGDASRLHRKRTTVQRHMSDLVPEIQELRAGWHDSKLRARLVEVLGSERRVQFKEVLIFALIGLVLALLGLEYLADVSDHVLGIFFAVDTACCVVFLADFFVEVRLSDDKKHYVKTHWVDFVTSIPIPVAMGGLDPLRAGRFLRLLRLLRVLRALRVVLFLWRGMEHLQNVMDVRLMRRTLTLTAGFIIVGAVLINVSEGEMAPEEVGTVWQSIWWSFTTTVTGGFGDIHNPSTGVGRILTVVLIVAGMVIVGVFTATLTAVLVRDSAEDASEERDRLEELLAEQLRLNRSLAERFDALEGRLDSVASTPEPESPG
ncbi:MAG: potassium channel family protein [Deltaproteobacteria bacterium]|nr:potassium channel family protein [Deltaproteobacteria bacterium]